MIPNLCYAKIVSKMVFSYINCRGLLLTEWALVYDFWTIFADFEIILEYVIYNFLQTHHVDSTLKPRENGRFHVVSTWNPRGVFVGLLLKMQCSFIA